MSKFITCLKAIESARDKKQREAAVEAAFAEMFHLTGDENFGDYAPYGDWINTLPGLIKTGKKRANKYLVGLIDTLAHKNKIFTEDTAKKLLLKIKKCKSIEEFNELNAMQLPYLFKGMNALEVKTITRLQITLDDRVKHALKKLPQGIEHNNYKNSIGRAYNEQKAYLEKKAITDKLTWPITIILSLLGVGAVCGIAFFAAFPVIGVVGFVAAAAVMGWVEIPVFKAFVQRSLRTLYARGMFQSMDNHLLNQVAQGRGEKSRHYVSDEKNASRLTKYAGLLRFKYALSVVGGLVAAAATVGFSALTFMQVVEVLPLLGVVGVAATVAPWIFAGLATLYFFVIFANIYRAIKNNIFAQIIDQTKKIFGMDGWDTASSKERTHHVLICIAKGFGLAFILGLAVVATVFSAGAWLNSSVEFFTAAFNIVGSLAEKLGMVIGVIQLVTTFGFNIENIVNSVASFSHVGSNLKKGILAYVNESIAKVNAEQNVAFKVLIVAWRIVRPLIDWIPLVFHLVGEGMVAAKGAEYKWLKPAPAYDEAVKIGVVATQAACEGAVDAHAFIPHVHEDDDHHHHHEEKHDHEHFSAADQLEWCYYKAKSSVCSMITFFTNRNQPAPELVEEKVVSIRP